MSRDCECGILLLTVGFLGLVVVWGIMIRV